MPCYSNQQLADDCCSKDSRGLGVEDPQGFQKINLPETGANSSTPDTWQGARAMD